MTGSDLADDSADNLKLVQKAVFFHHVMKNDVSLHNSVILLRMTAVLVYK